MNDRARSRTCRDSSWLLLHLRRSEAPDGLEGPWRRTASAAPGDTTRPARSGRHATSRGCCGALSVTCWRTSCRWNRDAGCVARSRTADGRALLHPPVPNLDSGCRRGGCWFTGYLMPASLAWEFAEHRSGAETERRRTEMAKLSHFHSVRDSVRIRGFSQRVRNLVNEVDIRAVASALDFGHLDAGGRETTDIGNFYGFRDRVAWQAQGR